MNFKRLSTLCCVACILLCGASLLPAGESIGSRALWIEHASLVDVTSGAIRENTNVLVVDGHIAGIGERVKVPAGARRVDATGKFLIPGLWDMHVHLAGLTADPKWSRDVLLPLLAASGVTGVRDMGGNFSALQEWRREIAAGSLLGPQIYAAGPMLDGGFVDPSVLLTRNAEEARARVSELKSMGVDFVKILSGLDRDTYFAVAEAARAAGMDFVGHVPPLVSVAEASEAHQKSIEHILYGGIPIACSSNDAALRQKMAAAMNSGALLQIAAVEDAATAAYDPKRAASLWKTLVKNHTWVVPTLVSTYTSSRLDELAGEDPGAQYLPRSLTRTWTADGLRVSLRAEKLAWWRRELPRQIDLVRQMHQAGVKVLAGTDALDPHNIPGASLAKELELLVEAGFTPLESLQAATLKPAQFMGRTDTGKIAKGGRADLVLLDGDPLSDIRNVRRIHAVIVGGRFLSRSELDQILLRLKEASAN